MNLADRGDKPVVELFNQHILSPKEKMASMYCTNHEKLRNTQKVSSVSSTYLFNITSIAKMLC